MPRVAARLPPDMRMLAALAKVPLVIVVTRLIVVVMLAKVNVSPPALLPTVSAPALNVRPEVRATEFPEEWWRVL